MSDPLKHGPKTTPPHTQNQPQPETNRENLDEGQTHSQDKAQLSRLRQRAAEQPAQDLVGEHSNQQEQDHRRFEEQREEALALVKELKELIASLTDELSSLQGITPGLSKLQGRIGRVLDQLEGALSRLNKLRKA